MREVREKSADLEEGSDEIVFVWGDNPTLFGVDTGGKPR